MRTLTSLLLVPTTFSIVSLVTVAGLAACSSDDDDTTDKGALDASIDASSRLDSGSTTPGDAGSADAAHDASLADGSTPVADASTDGGHPDAGDAASDAGSAWTLETLPVKDGAFSVGGTGPADVYVGGDEGIYHSTGNGTWTKEAQTNGVVLGLSDDGAGHMFAGNLFAELFTQQADGGWVGGDRSFCGNAQSRGGLLFVHGTTLFGATDGESEGYTCVSTVNAPSGANADTALGRTAWFSGTTQVFAAGGTPSSAGTPSPAGFVAYYDTSWHEIAAANGTLPPMVSVVAVGTSAIAVGASTVYSTSSDGPLTLLATAPSAIGTFSHAWGDSLSEVWAIGTDSSGKPAVTHISIGPAGVTFDHQLIPTTSGILYGVWGTGTGEIYVANDDGTILHKK